MTKHEKFHKNSTTMIQKTRNTDTVSHSETFRLHKTKKSNVAQQPHSGKRDGSLDRMCIFFAIVICYHACVIFLQLLCVTLQYACAFFADTLDSIIFFGGLHLFSGRSPRLVFDPGSKLSLACPGDHSATLNESRSFLKIKACVSFSTPLQRCSDRLLSFAVQ